MGRSLDFFKEGAVQGHMGWVYPFLRAELGNLASLAVLLILYCIIIGCSRVRKRSSEVPIKRKIDFLP